MASEWVEDQQIFASGLKPAIQDLEKTYPEAYENVLKVAAETCELMQFRDTGVMLHLVGRKRVQVNRCVKEIRRPSSRLRPAVRLSVSDRRLVVASVAR